MMILAYPFLFIAELLVSALAVLLSPILALRFTLWVALVLAVALAGMRVLVDSVPYEVVAVQPDVGGREYVDLVCQVVS